MPVLLARPTVGMSHATVGSMNGADLPLTPTVILLSVLVHTATMLIVAGILALVFFEFYDKVGLKMLRHTWFNFDLLWALALLVAAGAVLFR
jgi:cation transport ATPase